MKLRVLYLTLLSLVLIYFDAETGRIAIYYGAADTYTGVAFCLADELIDYIKANSEDF